MGNNYDPINPGDSLSDSRQKILNRDDTLRDFHSGLLPPSVIVPYMFWADTANGSILQRDSTNSLWRIVGKLDQDYLGAVAADGTVPMSGPLNMGNQRIQSLLDGVASQDAVTVNQIQSLTSRNFFAQLSALAPVAGINRFIYGSKISQTPDITHDLLTGIFTLTLPGVYEILGSIDMFGSQEAGLYAPGGATGILSRKSRARSFHGSFGVRISTLLLGKIRTGPVGGPLGPDDDGFTFHIQLEPGGIGGFTNEISNWLLVRRVQVL